MVSLRSSIHTLGGEDQTAQMLDSYPKSLEGLGLDGSSVVSSESISKRLGSAESASSGEFIKTITIL